MLFFLSIPYFVYFPSLGKTSIKKILPSTPKNLQKRFYYLINAHIHCHLYQQELQLGGSFLENRYKNVEWAGGDSNS